MSTEHFVHIENLKHLREVLARTKDAAQSQRIVTQIEEEELRYLVKK